MRSVISGGRWGLFGLLWQASVGCVAQDFGYHDIQTAVKQRTSHSPSWRHLEAHPQQEAERTRALLAEPLSADSVVELALLNNPSVQQAFEGLGMARAQALAALSVPNPRLEASLRFGDASPEWDLTLTENLSRLLLLPWRDGLATFELNASKFEVLARIMDAVLRAKQAYFEYQAALSARDLDKSLQELAGSALELASSLHAAGNTTALDLAVQKINYEESRVATRNLEAEVVRTEQGLRVALGLESHLTWSRVPGLPEPPDDAKLLDKVEQRGLERSLDLAIAELRAVGAQKRASFSRVEGLLPQLHAGVSAERQEGEWAVGPLVELELPVFYQGQGAVALAEAERRHYRSAHQSLQLEIRSALRVSAARLVTLHESAEHYRSTVLPLRAQVVDETQRNYNAMTVGVMQLLQARRAQIEAARTYVELLKTYWLARSELEQLRAGRLVPGGGATLAPQSLPISDTSAGRVAH